MRWVADSLSRANGHLDTINTHNYTVYNISQSTQAMTKLRTFNCPLTCPPKSTTLYQPLICLRPNASGLRSTYTQPMHESSLRPH